MLSVFTSRKVYSSQIKAVNLQTISELQKLSSIWREWDKKHAERHMWLPIPDPPKPGTPKPRPMPMMVHSTAIILANLSRGMAIWAHNVGTFEKFNSKKQTRNLQDTSQTEQENTKRCWQGLQMTVLSIWGGFTYRFSAHCIHFSPC